MTDRVKLSVFYPYPPEKVWQALTDCRALNIWMMNNDFEPRLGHKFKFESNSLPGITTIIHCEVVELNEPKRLVYTWQDEVKSEPSLVIWILTPVEGGTQLQLRHQPTGYATTVVSGKSFNFGRIGTRADLLFYEQPVPNFNKQMPDLSWPQLATKDELNSLVSYRDSKEEWDYRLNYKLPQALQHDC
ncbi:SRPBCC domain-containing protein [Pleurocapsa sp. PCC 7319]|uniref:SRPBCC family protein n=1 Tax=Pleurocapsa sp. PCC 7319 TaxID=118161 RepID=UPI000346F490|nr:SRPBCC domain-containing protein [Pleurocapsa sp. PCC 7319]